MLKSFALATTAVACSTVANAQEELLVPLRPHAPVQHFSYDLNTGATQRISNDAQGAFAGGGPTASFANANFIGSFAAPGSADVEWVDWGALTLPAATGGFNSPPVTEFTFGYASSVPDLAGTGVVDMEVTFFTTTPTVPGPLGDCNQANYPGVGRGVEVARFLLTALPGDDNPGDGLAAAFAFTVDLGPDAISLNEGSVGVGYRILTDPTLNGILLTTPADISGCFDPTTVGGTGTSDCFDQYNIAADVFTCDATGPFVFGDGAGGSAGISSFFVEIVQDASSAIPAAVRTATVPNLGTMTAVVDVAVSPCGAFSASGQPCPSVEVTSTFGLPAATFWAIAAAPSELPLGPLGTALINLTGGDPFLTLTGTGGFGGAPGSTIELGPIPARAGLVGLSIFTQGGSVDFTGAIELSNALDFVVGGAF